MRLEMYQSTSQVAAIAIAARVKDFMLRRLYKETLFLFKEKIHPLLPLFRVSFILPSIIKASSHSHDYHHSLQLHSLSIKSGTDQDPTVSNSLLTMYVKFQNIQFARKMFDTMPNRDTITWNSMINGYIQNNHFPNGVKTFKEMFFNGYEPKPELIASILSVCARCEAFRLGKVIHALLIVSDLNRDSDESTFVSTALIDLYFKCRDSMMAIRVFDLMEVVRNEGPWTAVISGFAADGNYTKALDYFRAMMVDKEEIKPNRVTLIAILPVCGSIRNGKQIHAYAIRIGLDSELSIVSSLINMYGNHLEFLHQARSIFDRSTDKDIVTWSSILLIYSQSETTAEETFILFRRMRMEGINPNSVTMLAILSACSTLPVLIRGRVSHGIVLKIGFGFHLFINNSLINMYSKCGSLSNSRQVFDQMSEKDNFSWSAIIGAHAQHGYGEQALILYNEMDVKLDEITYLSVLSACNNANLVIEAKKIFERMIIENEITLTLEHYACYVDLLGKAGFLEEACDVIEKMGMEPNMKIWSSLVSACKDYGRLEVAERLGKKVIELEPENCGFITLLCMVYAELGNWIAVEELRNGMKMRGLKKCQGFSWIC